MGNRLFVGNISWDAGDQDLQDFFDGAVSAKVITDRETGRSRGFGFVEMDTDGDAQRAIEDYNGVDFFGRPLRVSIAEERQPRQSFQQPPPDVGRRRKKGGSRRGQREDRYDTF